MKKSKHFILALIASASIGTQAVAEEQQTLELEAADVAVLHLATVASDAAANSNELHQEATLGRAGLAGNCMPTDPPPPPPPPFFTRPIAGGGD